jgi:hypothetical protein
VKQRLSRGRERLKAEVAALVEGALGATAPGPAFTSGVMAALPISAFSAKAALGGSGLAKVLATGAAFGGAFLGLGASLWGGYRSYREVTRTARSAEERAIVGRIHRFNLIGMVALVVAMGLFVLLDRIRHLPLWVEMTLVPAILLGFFLLQIPVVLGARRQLRELQARGVALGSRTRLFEYRTRAEFLGLPLIHVRLGGDVLSSCRPVKAWIAAGGIAFGGLAAYGGIAVAPICFGGIAAGLFAVGGLALGAVALAGVSVGAIAIGGQSLGWIALGGSAIGLKAAFGGIAIAHEYAVGGTAQAIHARDAAARAFFATPLLRSAIRGLPYISWIAVIGIIPFAIAGLLGRQRSR